jgi:hypothetical protein
MLDNVSSYGLWAVFGLLAIISIIFLTGHGVSLIADVVVMIVVSNKFCKEK